MKTRAERRNKNDDKNIEYEVFGCFKSRTIDADADAGDLDHRWMMLEDIFAALHDRPLIDGKVNDFFGCLPAAHKAAMDVLDVGVVA